MKKTLTATKSITLIIAFVFIIGAFVFPLSGCSPIEKTSLYVVTMFGGEDAHAEVLDRINNEFFQETNIEIINNSSKASSLWQSNVRMSFTTEVLTPDVLYYFNGTAADSIRENLVSLAEIKEYDPEYGKDITVSSSDKDCLLFKGFSEGIVYNIDYFDVEDFESYQSLKNKIKSNNYSESTDNIAKIAAGNDVPHYWFNYLMVLALGVNEFSEFDGTRDFFDESRIAKWKAAIDWSIAEMKEMGICTDKTRLEVDESSRFYEGNRGLLIDGSWVAGKINSSKVSANFEIAAFPKNEEKPEMPDFNLNGFTSGWYITKKAWNNEKTRRAAVDFVKKHTSAEAIEEYCKTAGGIPATGKDLHGVYESVNKFISLTNNAVSVTPLDDRISYAAKSNLYSQNNGIVAMLRNEGNITAESVFNAFYNALDK